jgi:hypothetical protein
MFSVSRVATMCLVGAIAGAAALGGAFRAHPDLTFEFDRDPPGRVLTGFYPAEIVGEDTFAWASDRAQVILPGVDRRIPWQCSVRFRGGRPPGVAQPHVELAVDGQPAADRAAENDYRDLEGVAPPRAVRGLRLTLSSSSTFVPSADDPRPLGLQVDRISCLPQAGASAWPPASAFVDATLASAMFGALFAMTGLGTLAAALATLAVAIVQALPLSTQLAPYTAYAGRAVWLAFWVTAPIAAVLLWLRASKRVEGLRDPSFGFAFSAAALFVKLLGLLHPSKLPVDAVFHAHRLEYILSGRYFFTQVLPGGVQFPYAIALYVIASPWAALTRDHVALLRIVTSVAEAGAGVLLYWAVLRTWRDWRAAAWALVLFHLLPVSYWIAGNANLTNGFGQSAAVGAMSLLIVWRLDARHWLNVLGLSVLAAVALLSHVSTFALLASTMAAVAFMYRWRGGRELQPAALSVVVALAIAVAASVLLYYGRSEFFDAYKSVRGAQVESAGRVQTDAAADTRLAEGAIPVMSLPARVASAAGLTGDALGWPIVALALLGLWRVLAERSGDRLVWAIAAWAAASGAFFVFGIVAPGGVGHQRQAMEFIARAVFAGSPAAIVLAGYGGVWAWRAGGPLRVAAAGSLALTTYIAGRIWISWWT